MNAGATAQPLLDKENVDSDVLNSSSSPVKASQELTMMLETANIRNEVLREKNNDLGKELASKNEECADLRMQISIHNENLTEIKLAAAVELESARSEAKEALETSTAAKTATEQERERCESTIKELSDKLLECETECESLRSRVEVRIARCNGCGTFNNDYVSWH